MLGIHSNHSKPNLKPVVDLDYHVRPCLPTAIIKTPKGEISFQREFFKDFQRVEESMPRCWHLNTLALNMLALWPSILLFMVVFLLICHQCVWLLFLTFFFWSLYLFLKFGQEMSSNKKKGERLNPKNGLLNFLLQLIYQPEKHTKKQKIKKNLHWLCKVK